MTDTDVLYPVYVGLSIAVGILGFIITSLITHSFMPSFLHLSEFAAFLCGAGWVAIWIIYITLYSLAAYLGWQTLEARLKER
jgi:uncharacterized membrane protein